jgi:quercetin dioxygenase-like cupin family protein
MTSVSRSWSLGAALVTCGAIGIPPTPLARVASGSNPTRLPMNTPVSTTMVRIKITPRTERPTTDGPKETFTGAVRVESLFAATDHTRAAAASVTFAPCARTAWHSHPAGQTLIVTSGRGWVQEWGGARREINIGDVIWTPPGVKHWHGASATDAMTHIAIQEHVNGKVVDWMEHVSDEQYGAQPERK